MALRAREAAARGERVVCDQRWVPYARISQNLKRAVLVTEDSAFWTHDGVDLDQLRESMEVNWERGEFARGASTITQQLAREPVPVAVQESVPEASGAPHRASPRSVALEAAHLRVVSERHRMGRQRVGCGSRVAPVLSQTCIGSLGAESALLAGAISNPRTFDPAHPSARLKRRQQMIMRRMGAATPPPVVPEPTLLPVEAPGIDAPPIRCRPPRAPTVLPGTAPCRLTV